MSLQVAALYRFARFDAPAALRGPLLALCVEQGVFGTVLLAREGVNGTIAGSAEGVDAVIVHLRALPGCAELDVKYSEADAMPFGKMKVRLKKEIVTMGVPGVDPVAGAGDHVAAAHWNALIADPETLVIDTRNGFEVAMGSFDGAVDPETARFGDFPGWFRANREALMAGKSRVAMFCTGGIRCEKATAFVKAEGVADVRHLKGGILKYLEEVPEAQSLWRGDCFVFDERVALGHGLAISGNKADPQA